MKLTILVVVTCFAVATAQFWGDDFGDRFDDFRENLWDRYDDMYDDWGYSPNRWNNFRRPWGGWNQWGWGRRHYRPHYYHRPRRHYGYNKGYNPGYSNYGQLMSNMYLYNKIFDWFFECSEFNRSDNLENQWLECWCYKEKWSEMTQLKMWQSDIDPATKPRDFTVDLL